MQRLGAALEYEFPYTKVILGAVALVHEFPYTKVILGAAPWCMNFLTQKLSLVRLPWCMNFHTQKRLHKSYLLVHMDAYTNLSLCGGNINTFKWSPRMNSLNVFVQTKQTVCAVCTNVR